MAAQRAPEPDGPLTVAPAPLFALFATMWVVVALIYAPTMTHDFIADDLTNLDFIHHSRESLARAFIPGAAFSAPVTRSRYMPLHLVYWWVTARLFGDTAAPYHVLCTALHAAVATAVAVAARLVFAASWRAAVVAGLLFATNRLHAQSVIWVSVGFRLLATLMVLIGLIFLHKARRSRVGVAVFSAAFVASLLMNPDVLVIPLLTGAMSLNWRGEVHRDRRWRQATWIAGGACVLFVAANHWSQRVFPDPLGWRRAPDPQTLLTCLTSLLLPFALPGALKVAALAAASAVLIAFARTRRCAAWTGCALGAALLWSFSTYEITPRYLYLPSALFTPVLVAALAQDKGPRWRALPAFGALALAIASVRGLWTTDIPSFAYLSELPRRLRITATTAEPGTRVFIAPASDLPPADLAYFTPPLRFVSNPAQAQVVVNTGVEEYRDRLGPHFGERYWFQPWFTSGF